MDAPTTHKGGNITGGLVLIVLGLLFLAGNFFPEINFSDYWPLILVAVGVGLLWKARRGTPRGDAP